MKSACSFAVALSQYMVSFSDLGWLMCRQYMSACNKTDMEQINVKEVAQLLERFACNVHTICDKEQGPLGEWTVGACHWTGEWQHSMAAVPGHVLQNGSLGIMLQPTCVQCLCTKLGLAALPNGGGGLGGVQPASHALGTSLWSTLGTMLAWHCTAGQIPQRQQLPAASRYWALPNRCLDQPLLHAQCCANV